MTQPSAGDLDAFLRLPRLSGLELSPDGTRLVTAVASLDHDGTRWVSALWEVDPTGEAPARRLTRSAKGETSARFVSTGDLLFTSARPDPDATEEDDPKAMLWLLPAAGGEARVIARAAGGLGDVVTARDVPVVSVTAPVLGASVDLDDDAERRKARKERKVSAILHTAYPVRIWDHDLGPDQPRRYLATLGEDELDLRQLTGAGPQLQGEYVGASLSPDGAALVTAWLVPEGAGQRMTVVVVDSVTGECRTLLDDPDTEYVNPVVSPDGRWVVAEHHVRSTATTAPAVRICLVPFDGSEPPRILAPAWDRWPASFAWLADSSGIVLTADSDGRCPVFLLALDDPDAVRQVTADDAAFTDVRVSPDGATLYALRSSYLAPAEPVRVDLAAFRASCEPVQAQLLRGPAAAPALPGTLTEVEATAADGARVRGWLALPDGASADAPAPLLLWIHGGPLNSWNAWSWRWNPWLMVARGYAVLLPDPALSTGYGQEFVQRGWGAWGDAPFTDLMAVTDACVARPDVDEERTAAMGGSFGGYMANWVAGHTDRFRCIVTHASLWSLEGFGPTTDGAFYWEREMSPAMMAAHSPHHFVDRIVTPMLVIHGDKDYRVPIGEGLRLWYELLTKSGLPAADDGTTEHRFLYFPDENHWVLTPEHARVWYQTCLGFLGRHLLDEEMVTPDLLA
ncbi:prolyl oligopeptidase family serine peptidase [Nocardioides jiangxiensis]|uniref:Prolyl oligopeptidase family serine peptidase n=1 Tax=Nocardioides jiangxiensis TaxID=3064524 RepID=A0ABT9B1N0_9ACTN|nr:prolyl oligopeptidase family serine peptidase [Nocardioides sp. WY-20]MDO7868767.1 prolyl oligopeptidase family serine peptidase [Nocardioides sp. WY-20]